MTGRQRGMLWHRVIELVRELERQIVNDWRQHTNSSEQKQEEKQQRCCKLQQMEHTMRRRVPKINPFQR